MRGDIKESILFLFKEEDITLFNKAELSRRYNCDPRTIDRYIKIAKGEIEAGTQKREYKSKLDEFKPIIINKVDKYGCTAKAVYQLIQKKGYTGKYSILANFVKKHKEEETQKATIRFETNPGLQAQVDWKEDMILTNKEGIQFKINIFLMVMGYSRNKFIIITTDRSQETLFECMIAAFKYYGGVPHEILFDNMKTVVDHAKSSFAKTVFNDKFEVFAKDIGFTPIACRPYRPQTKGKAEALAKLVDRLRVYNEEFTTWDDLKNITTQFREDINKEYSQGCEDIPIELFQKEKEYLLPLPNEDLMTKYISRQEEKTYLVNKESLIRYEGRKYSVPTNYIGKRVTVKKDANDNLHIYYNNEFVLCHKISDKKYNYTVETITDILRSDAMRGKSDQEIFDFIKNNLSQMDICIGGI